MVLSPKKKDMWYCEACGIRVQFDAVDAPSPDTLERAANDGGD